MFTFDLKDTCCSFFILSYKVSPTKGSLGNKCCINKIIFVRTWLYFFSFYNNIAVPFITFFVLILISTSRFISRRTWKFVFVCNQMKGLYTTLLNCACLHYMHESCMQAFMLHACHMHAVHA